MKMGMNGSVIWVFFLLLQPVCCLIHRDVFLQLHMHSIQWISGSGFSQTLSYLVCTHMNFVYLFSYNAFEHWSHWYNVFVACLCFSIRLFPPHLMSSFWELFVLMCVMLSIQINQNHSRFAPFLFFFFICSVTDRCFEVENSCIHIVYIFTFNNRI